MILIVLIIDVIGWLLGWANQPPRHYDHHGKRDDDNDIQKD